MELDNIEKLAEIIPISNQNKERKERIIKALEDMGTLDVSFAAEEAGSLEVYERVIDYNARLENNKELQTLINAL